MRRLATLLAVAGVLAVATAACGGAEEKAGEAGRPKTADFERGGTLRLGLLYLDDLVHATNLPSRLDYFFDPQWIYDPTSWELFRCCLLRTLLSYNGHPTKEGGAEVRPDLAAGMPEVSPDGLTWTFRLKKGIRYGPLFDSTSSSTPTRRSSRCSGTRAIPGFGTGSSGTPPTSSSRST